MTPPPVRKHDLVLWAFLSNATLLLVHEIDSAYRHEWIPRWGVSPAAGGGQNDSEEMR